MGSDSADTTIKVTKFLHLKEDGSNWLTYRDQTMHYFDEKGLYRHVRGSVKMPEELIIHEGRFYNPSDINYILPLSDSEINERENAVFAFHKLEGAGNAILDATLPPSIYRQIRPLKSLAKKWSKLCQIFEHHGDAVQEDLYTRIQNCKYKGGSMHAHLSYMSELRDQLIQNDYEITDANF
ncbi:hypothetical protein FA15DRAFT_710671, partial [Coprinopsis marcescibilis]